MNNACMRYMFLFVGAYSYSYVSATVESALLDWGSKASPATQQLKAYQDGYRIGLSLGKQLRVEQAVTILKPWIFFQGAKENQKHCTLDSTVNNAIEAVIKNVAQSALIGRFESQISDVIEKQIQAQTEAYITGPAKTAYEYATSAAKQVGTTASQAKETASEAAGGITETVKGWWNKWFGSTK